MSAEWFFPREIYTLYLELADIKRSDRNARIKSIEYLNGYIADELDYLSSIRPGTKLNDINKINEAFYETVMRINNEHHSI